MMMGFRSEIVRVVGALAAIGLLLAGGCDVPLVGLPNFADWPVDTTGYTIELLPAYLAASFARGNDVYFALADGKIYKADDRDLSKPWADLGSPLTAGPRMVFASSAGVVFTSENDKPTWRRDDDGARWSVCLDAPVWRMSEDDLGALYAGNYTQDDQHVATLYKSTDGGVTWAKVFRDESNRHIHTVGWDDRANRLYIAFGDNSATRGQAYSDDRGGTFTVIAAGRDQGHTDVAFSADYVFWASDDQSGRVFRVDRQTGFMETLMGVSQFMWFAVAGDQQVYVGTMTSQKAGGERAALLASADQGNTWQRLLETDPSAGPYDQGFNAESRALSAGGWLYCSGGAQSYRIRRNSP
jgi:photosystem II stability/assembly factor-like uncharacterized protein